MFTSKWNIFSLLSKTVIERFKLQRKGWKRLKMIMKKSQRFVLCIFFSKLNTHHHYSLIRLQWILPSDEWLFAGHISHLHTVIRQGRTLCDWQLNCCSQHANLFFLLRKKQVLKTSQLWLTICGSWHRYNFLCTVCYLLSNWASFWESLSRIFAFQGSSCSRLGWADWKKACGSWSCW